MGNCIFRLRGPCSYPLTAFNTSQRKLHGLARGYPLATWQLNGSHVEPSPVVVEEGNVEGNALDGDHRISKECPNRDTSPFDRFEDAAKGGRVHKGRGGEGKRRGERSCYQFLKF